MACNPCCCFSLKDSAVTIGIWTVVYSIASLFLFGWQTGVLNHCRSVTMSQANLQCEWDCPCVGASTARTARIIEGLFVIQILCLISAFFLLFASVSLIYGVHTWSRYLIWPWFPCIISSILCSLAYCIMWWAGDVRDYWMALTILETIGVFINVYCVVVVMMYYRRINITTDEYEGKDRRVKYKVNRHGYSNRRDLMDSYDQGRQTRTPEQIMKSPYTNYMTPIHQPYPPYSPSDIHYPPSQLPKYSAAPPYPIDSNEPIFYDREPKSRVAYEAANEDPVAHWVKDQQKIERTEANSEPVSPSKEVLKSYPMQHSRSVPSMFDGTLVSHKSCRHGKYRSSSRHQRSKVRHGSTLYSSDSETQTEFTRHRDGSRRRHRSKSRYSESEVTDVDYRQRPRRSRRSRDDHRSRDDRERDARKRRKEKNDDRWSQKRYRQEKDDEDHDRNRKHRQRDKDSRGGKEKHRCHKHRDRKEDEDRDIRKMEKLEDHTLDVTPPEGLFPLSGGITIPQHIVIPPTAGERGPDGQPLPQKFQINSEITINYDQSAHNLSAQSDQQEPYRRRYPPISIQSNV